MFECDCVRAAVYLSARLSLCLYKFGQFPTQPPCGSLLGSERWDWNAGEDSEPHVRTAKRWNHHKRGGSRQGAPGVPARRERRKGTSQGNLFHPLLPPVSRILVLYTFRSNITMHSQHPHKAWWDTFPMKHVLMHSFVFFIQWDSTGELHSTMCRNRNHAIMFFSVMIYIYNKILYKNYKEILYIRRVQMQTFSPKLAFIIRLLCLGSIILL